ncbi:MAG: tetratricopeptide repeat protein, partial [candidate division WOR-3 bacterium]
AENIFTTIISKYPNTRSGRQSIYYLGYIYYLTKRFNEAKDQFERYLSKEKKSYLLVPSALIGLGSTREGLKDYEGALAAYEKIIEEHSNSPFLLQAKLFAGRIKAQLGDYEGAKRYLEEVIKDKNAGALSEQAKFYLGYYGPR